jgi:hypothetical protein
MPDLKKRESSFSRAMRIFEQFAWSESNFQAAPHLVKYTEIVSSYHPSGKGGIDAEKRRLYSDVGGLQQLLRKKSFVLVSRCS